MSKSTAFTVIEKLTAQRDALALQLQAARDALALVMRENTAKTELLERIRAGELTICAVTWGPEIDALFAKLSDEEPSDAAPNS